MLFFPRKQSTQRALCGVVVPGQLFDASGRPACLPRQLKDLIGRLDPLLRLRI
jgi:hypothetical protein